MTAYCHNTNPYNLFLFYVKEPDDVSITTNYANFNLEFALGDKMV